MSTDEAREAQKTATSAKSSGEVVDLLAALRSVDAAKAARGESAEFPSSWVIEVCRTCGRVAQWPFCEHREQHPSDGRPWCLPVVVKGSLPAKHRLSPAGGAQ